MIGKVIFALDGDELEAVLGDDGRWSCSNELVSILLNTVYSVEGYSVSHGRFGWAQLHSAAKALDGRVEGIEDDPETEDLIY